MTSHRVRLSLFGASFAAVLLASACTERVVRVDAVPDGGVSSGSLPALPDGDGGEGDGNAAPLRSSCERYLSCAAIASPATLPTLLEGYGPNGTCFRDGEDAVCESACLRGLSQLRTSSVAPECGCDSDAECMETGAPYCDVTTRRCGECKSSDGCGRDDACLRQPPRPGYNATHCGRCAETGPGFSDDSCGTASPGSGALASAAPYCARDERGTPTCGECRNDFDCPNQAACDPATHRCASSPNNCNAMWECLRRAPVECTSTGGCCGASTCPAAPEYLTCMNTHCAQCDSASECVECSIAHCKASYQACMGSCAR